METPFSHRARSVGSLALLVLFVQLLIPLPALAATSNPYLAQAKVFYQGLEFEKCVQRLTRAVTWKASPAQEQAEIELYSGLCQYNLGRKDEVKAHFREALKLDPHVDLPVLTSPKLVSVFDEVAEEFSPQREAPPGSDSPTANTVRAADRSYNVEAPSVLGPSVGRAVAPAATKNKWPLVTMSAGGAVLIAGGVLGLLALRDAGTFNNASKDPQTRLTARANALSEGQAADICYIAGGTLAALGLVLQFTLKDAPARARLVVGPKGAGISGAFW